MKCALTHSVYKEQQNKDVNANIQGINTKIKAKAQGQMTINADLNIGTETKRQRKESTLSKRPVVSTMVL